MYLRQARDVPGPRSRRPGPELTWLLARPPGCRWPGPARPATGPGTPGTSQVHARYMAGPCQVHGRPARGIPQVHGRSMGAGWMGLRSRRFPHLEPCMDHHATPPRAATAAGTGGYPDGPLHALDAADAAFRLLAAGPRPPAVPPPHPA